MKRHDADSPAGGPGCSTSLEHTDGPTGGVRALSRSRLWELQEDFFERTGPTAWSRGIVPHYVTSNPSVAHAYLETIVGCLAQGSRHGFDPAHPVYVLELGAGCGRFAYHFLHLLDELETRNGPLGYRLVYLLTDLAADNVEFCRSHPAFARWVEDGRIEFARFDVERDRAPVPMSGTRPAQTDNPLIVIGNYVFDGLRHDLFRVEHGSLTEVLVSLRGHRTRDDDADPMHLEDVELAFVSHPVDPGARYPDESWTRLLRSYPTQLRTGDVSMPTGALRCIDRLRSLSGDRLLLLSTDKGYCHWSDREGVRERFGHAQHGSVSFSVNFDGLIRYTRAEGGAAWAGPPGSGDLQTVVLGFGLDADSLQRSFVDAMDSGGPQAFFDLKKVVERSAHHMGPGEMLSILRLSHWDHAIMRLFLPWLVAEADAWSPRDKRLWRDAIHRVRAMYFPIGEDFDLDFELGVLLIRLGSYEDAVARLESSRAEHGDDAGTLYNLALCHWRLGAPQDAVALLRAALDLDPDYEDADRLMADVQATGQPT